MRFILLGLALFTSEFTLSQSKIYTWRAINLGIAPGLSTNGIHPKNFANKISINLFAGYSAALSGVELSGISSFHSYSSSGIQISGIANTVGGNRKDLKEYTESDLSNLTSNYHGMQISGAVNTVTGSVIGIQIGGMTNLIFRGHGSGMQIAGFVNYVDGYLEGVQVSSLINVSKKHITGAQISMLLNSTEGEVYGVQLGAWNSASTLYGPKSEAALGAGIQFGAINISRQIMDGYQVGLLNYGASSRGFQLGIVNINHKTDGYPVALLNIGKGRMGMKVTADNISKVNIHLLTGSKKLTNTLLLGFEVGQNKKDAFVLGYSLGKTKHLRKGRIFTHHELMFRSMSISFKTFEFLPILSANSSLAFHIRGGIYASLGAGINYDVKDYFISRNAWFPSVIIGVAALE